jgi:3-carboxy-cis,cis-muconate cycloisomerase
LPAAFALVGETDSVDIGGRGGSSTMPHKHNPVGAALAQEHERALGGWQAEWPTLAALIETLGSAVQAMGEVAAGLAIDPDAMQANMDATEGAVLAERATFLLAEKLGKQKAGRLVEEALAKGGSFIEVLGQLEKLEKELSDEMALLGYSPKFVDRLMAELRRK